MLFRTHVFFGFLTGLIALDYFNIENKFLFLVFAVLFSSFPDVDHSGSMINRKFFVFRIFSFLFKHRGFMHSIFFALILFLIARHFGYDDIGYGVMVGFLAHLLADGLTKSGVRMFYPLFKFRMRGFIKTGGLLEKVLFIAIVILIILKVARLY